MRITEPIEQTVAHVSAVVLRYKALLMPSRQQTDRKSARNKRLILTASASLVAKLILVISTFITIPVTLRYLDSDQFGVWMTASSIIPLLSFADLGIGNGLLNLVAKAYGTNDIALAKRSISSSFFILVLISALLAIGFSMFYPRVDWGAVYNVSTSQAKADCGVATAVFAMTFVVGIPLGLVDRVRFGYQQGYIRSCWQVVGSVVGMLALFLVVHFEAGLPWLVLAVTGGPLLAQLAHCLQLFALDRRDLAPNPREVDPVLMKTIMTSGFMFLILQLTAVMVTMPDNFIVAHLFDASEVGNFSVPMKMFTYVLTIIGVTSVGLWPAYGEALASGDVEWVEQSLRRSIVGAVAVSTIGSIPLVLLHGLLLKLWVGQEFDLHWSFWIGLAVWTVLVSAWQTLGIFMNGTGIIGRQAMVTVVIAVSCIVAKIVFGSRYGLPGMVWGGIGAFALTGVLPFSYLVPKWWNGMKQSARLVKQSSLCGDTESAGVEVSRDHALGPLR